MSVNTESAVAKALREAIGVAEAVRPVLRAAAMRPTEADAEWDAMLARWRSALGAPMKGAACLYCSGWVDHPDMNEACIRDPVRCVGMPGYTGDARPLK